MLALLVFGLTGTIAELLLLEHYEEGFQLVPLWLIGLALGVVAWHFVRPHAGNLRALQVLMVLFLFAGAAGIGVHLNGAAEFQWEIDPSQSRWEVVKKAFHALVGKGLLDPNAAAETELLSLPHLTPGLVKEILVKRPFMSITKLNAYLVAQKATPEQATELYKKAFVQVNLNTTTREEFVLIPGAGTRMAREFAEYRPWKSWAQFDKEIGKYVGQQETDRLKQYVFIPGNLNTATDDDILSIPGAGQRILREFKEYRPWKSKAQFDKKIGKYVGARETDLL